MIKLAIPFYTDEFDSTDIVGRILQQMILKRHIRLNFCACDPTESDHRIEEDINFFERYATGSKVICITYVNSRHIPILREHGYKIIKVNHMPTKFVSHEPADFTIDCGNKQININQQFTEMFKKLKI